MSAKSILVGLTLCLILTACSGASYRVPRGISHVDLTDQETASDVIELVSDYLRSQGFVEGERANTRQRLIEGGLSEAEADVRLDRFARDRRAFNHPVNAIRFTIVNYDEKAKRSSISTYADIDLPVVEINIYEHQPGGFSAHGLKVHAELTQLVAEQLQTTVRILQEPVAQRPGVAEQHRRQVIVNFLISWILALTFTLGITGTVTAWTLNRTSLRPSRKAAVFVVVNTFIAAPLPMPIAFTAVIFLPNLVAFPWTEFSYYQRIMDFVAISFPATAAVCALIAWMLWRRNRVPVS